VTNEENARSFGFSKAKRLTRSAEFQRVKNEGSSARGNMMVVGVLVTEVDPLVRFRAGFVTSKRIGGAVVRNRVRRRLREIVRRHQHSLRSGIWFVVIARVAAAPASYAQLEDEWLRLAKRTFILAP
jgi:ribonuclease P protein component